MVFIKQPKWNGGIELIVVAVNMVKREKYRESEQGLKNSFCIYIF